jgi:hypothetical protein
MTKKKQYAADKKVKDLYHAIGAEPNESYSNFKRRIKRDIGY